MSTSKSTTAKGSQENSKDGFLHIDETSMKTNRVEQVSSILVSTAVMLGMAVAMLFLLFLHNAAHGGVHAGHVDAVYVAHPPHDPGQ